jgi:hypothetical protein
VSSSNPSSSSSSAARRTILLRRAALGPGTAGGGGGGAGGGGVGARESGSAAPASAPAGAALPGPAGLALGAAGRTGPGEQEPPPPPHHSGATAGPGASKPAAEQTPALPGGGGDRDPGLPGTQARPGATLRAGCCGGGGGAGAAEPPSAHGRPRCGLGAAAGAGAAARGAPGGGGREGGGGGLQRPPGVTYTLGSPARAAPEPLTRRATSLTPCSSGPPASPPRTLNPEEGWLQIGALGTRRLSLFGGDRALSRSLRSPYRLCQARAAYAAMASESRALWLALRLGGCG